MKRSYMALPFGIFGIILVGVLINFLMSLEVKAEDFGVWGESTKIAEEDFEDHIVKQLEALGEDKLRSHQELIKDKIVADIKRPRAVENISKALDYRARLFDPSFVVEENIYDHNNQLLYPSGIKVNPLEKKKFEEIWILIDGDDRGQVEFARNYHEPNNLNNKTKKIILVNGAPGSQEDGSFFFFDQKGEISKRLNITKVPSVIRQSPNEPQILIEEIALDAEGKEVNNSEREEA